MAKFKYSMQNVLDIKYKLEDQAKTEYSNIQYQVNLEKEKLDSLYDRKEGYEKEFAGLMNGKISLLKLQECEYAIDTMKYYITKQTDVLKKKTIELENAREKLEMIMLDCKTHEKLKEKQFQQFLSDLNEQEKKEIDELVSYQYNKPVESREEQ